jgi:STAS domain
LGSTLWISICRPLARADLPGLSRRVSRLLATAAARELRCDVEDLPADAVTLDALARVQLAARRRGVRLEVLGASSELVALLAFTGLAEVLDLPRGD